MPANQYWLCHLLSPQTPQPESLPFISTLICCPVILILSVTANILQVVLLVAKILPPVPFDAALPSAAPNSAVPANAPQPAADERVQFLEQNGGLLEKFSRDLLPPLLHVRCK